MSKSTLTQLDPLSREFRQWLRTPGFRAPKGTMFHHCYKPDTTMYRGRSTIAGVRRVHMGPKINARDILAKAYAAHDMTLFTARPLDHPNWAHGVIQRRAATPEAELWAAAQKYRPAEPRMFPNRDLFGLETVANFDYEMPDGDGDGARAFECALRVLTAVHQEFHLPAEMLFFHRDGANKTCPGRLLDRDEVREELMLRLGGALPMNEKGIRVVLDGLVVSCQPVLRAGFTTLQPRPLFEALGILLPSLLPTRMSVRDVLPILNAAGWTLVFRKQAQGVRYYVKRVA